MNLLRSLEDLPRDFAAGAVTIGNFDGVHRGHARIIERLLARAQSAGGPSVVFTFDPHPVRLLRPSAAPPPLTWTDRKAALLAELGVDLVIAYPTDPPLLELSPRQFFGRIIVDRLQARAMVEGPNFFFGKDRAGNIELLGELCSQAGIALEIVEPLVVGDQIVSSSRIRQLIQQGEVAEAAQLLARPYRIRGMVTHGAARGATIGFPTANLEAVDTLVPGHGVYAGRGWLDQQNWPAAINIGPNPTFGQHATKIEAHLVGFHGTLYAQPLEIDFLAHLRNIQTFASIDDLKQQLAKDVAQSKRITDPR